MSQMAFLSFTSELGYELTVQVSVDEFGEYDILSVVQQEDEECYHMIAEVVLTDEDHEHIIEELKDLF